MLTDRACLSVGCDYFMDDLLEHYSEDALQECPRCHEMTFVRIASAPARMIFK